MPSITLSKNETKLWERSDSESDAFCRSLRATLRRDYPGEHVEIYSHDGITLDAFDVEVEREPENDTWATEDHK